MKTQRWQDWVNVLVGLWIFISPWAVQHAMTSGAFEATTSAMWNMYVVGIAVALIAIAALVAFQAWEEWSNMILGGWLLISPWIFGFSGSTALTWNAVVAGAVVIVLAAWSMGNARSGEQSAV